MARSSSSSSVARRAASPRTWPADLRLLFEDGEALEHVEAVALAGHLREQRLDVPAGCEERLVGDR